MGRRPSIVPNGQAKTQPPRRRLFRNVCSSHSSDVVDVHSPPLPQAQRLNATTERPSSDTFEKGPQRGESDLVSAYPTEASPLRSAAVDAAPGSTEHTSSGVVGAARRGSVYSRRGSRVVERRTSAASALLHSEAASAPRRASRVEPLPSPPKAAIEQQQQQQQQHQQQQHQQQQQSQQLSSSANGSTQTTSSLPMLTGPPRDTASSTYPAYGQGRPQLRALPAPDSRLLVFNTQMTSPVPMLVHGAPQHNFISLSGPSGFSVNAASPDHFSSHSQLHSQALPAIAPTSASTAQQSGTTTQSTRRRSRLMAVVMAEPSASAYTRVPPPAPALHFSNFVSDGGSSNGNNEQRDNSHTPRSITGGGSTRPASGASLTAAPSLWSSAGTPYFSNNTSTSTAASGGGNDLVALVPGNGYSRTTSTYSANSNSLNSGSLASSSSIASFMDQGPMHGGTSPVPLAERAFAPWQNSSDTMMPLGAEVSQPTSEEAQANPVGASILMPRRSSLHSSCEATLGSSSFISARLRKGSREAEAAREVETVAEFVARMKATKKKLGSDGAGGRTPESGDLEGTRAGLTSSSAGSRGTVGAVPLPVPAPPPPPQRPSRASEDDGHVAHAVHRHGSFGATSDTPLDGGAAGSHSSLTQPSSPPSTSTNERDGTSTGSGRSGSSRRRRDVKASVEAALANMSSTTAPSPSVASRRKQRDMAVNFLFAP